MAGETGVILGAIISVGGLIGTIATYLLEHPGERYEEKVDDLQTDRWGDVSTELGDVLADVNGSVDNGDQEEADEDETDTPPARGRYSLYIQNELTTEELADLREKLRAVEVPRELFQTCRQCRDRALLSFAVACGLGVISLGSFVLSPLPNGFSLGALVAGFGVPTMAYAGKRTYDSWSARERLDEIWEQYQFM